MEVADLLRDKQVDENIRYYFIRQTCSF